MASVYRAGDIGRRQLMLGALVCLVLAGAIVVFAPAHYEKLPPINAMLNSIATVLLVFAFVAVKRRHEVAHTWAMLGAFAVSTIFLACYLTYHRQLYLDTGLRGKRFTGQGLVRTVYYTVLITHVILAAAVPFLAGISIYLGLKDRRARHRKIAVIAFPVWLYVSVTGVVIYLMLYQLYPASADAPKIVSHAISASIGEVR